MFGKFNHDQPKLLDKSEGIQHFSLRKLSVGLASVALATTFLVAGPGQAKAETTDSSQQAGQSTVVEKNDDSSNTASDASKPAVSTKKAGSAVATAQGTKEDAANKNEESTVTQPVAESKNKNPQPQTNKLETPQVQNGNVSNATGGG
jgi:hypothetical protein